MAEPLCKFCGVRHWAGGDHPEKAVREALERMRSGPEPELSGFAVGEPEPRVTKQPVSVTKLERVTKLSEEKKPGRPRTHETNAERQRAYRARRVRTVKRPVVRAPLKDPRL